MHIPTITKSQRLIITHLSSFRFLTIDHLQQLFNHKDPHRIQEWLINLEEKKFIAIIKDPKNKTTPYIICLDQKARHILKDIDPRFKVVHLNFYTHSHNSFYFYQRKTEEAYLLLRKGAFG